MRLFRLSRSAYCRDLSGRGAELAGGRWNTKGIPVIYTADSRALSMAEVAVHLSMHQIPKDYMMVEIEIEASASVNEIPLNSLPSNWDSFPISDETQQIGDHFIRGNKFLILKAPSAVVPGDFNFLINPLHPEMKLVKIVQISPFSFDARLFN